MERRMRETHWMGLPIPGSPLVFFHPPFLRRSPQFPPSSEHKPAHIPLERGGAGMVAVCYVHPGVLLIKPTSLMRGKGLIAGLWGVVGRELRCRGRMVVVEE